jgi:hypothetical protein
MQGQQPPSSAGTVRGACLARWRWAIAIVSGLALPSVDSTWACRRSGAAFSTCRSASISCSWRYVGGGIYLPCRYPRW